MRKVFLVLMALSLSGLFVACSDDDSPVTPEVDFEITTAAITTGYTCSPYNIQLEAVGGTEPYTWSLAVGSTLPAGVTLSSDGRLSGLLEDTGSWAFTAVCTDSDDIPSTDQVNLTFNVEVPANPSIAIFYDGEATVCGEETMAFTPLDCYVFVMLEGGTPDCVFASEFMITIEDEDGNVLNPGTDFTHSYISYPDDVAIMMGDPFSGIVVSFDKAMQYAYFGNAHVMTFGLLLLEDLDNLSFKVGPSPDSGMSRPIIATCDQLHSRLEVDGRTSALNF